MNTMLSWLHSSAAERLGWMLVHSLWQLALLAGVYLVVRQLLRRSSAAARYLAACAIMVCMVLALPLTALLIQARPSLVMPPRATEPGHAMVPATIPPPTDETFVTEVAPPRTAASAAPEAPVMPARVDWKERLEALFTAVLPWIVAVWFVGVFALAARQFGGWLMLRRLCGTGTEPVDEVLADELRNLAQRLGVRRVVRLLSSVQVVVPSAIGHLKPVILLPASLLSGLSTEQIEALLAHELAHIRRHDYLVNLVQVTCETVLFYHPAAWWLSREIRREREHCCDDLAVQVCGDRIAYARTLATLEEHRLAIPTAAMAATGGSLMQRIRRLVVQPAASEAPRGTWLARMLVVLSICMAVPLAISAGSQRQDEDPAQSTELNRNMELVAKLKQQASTVYETFGERNGRRYLKGLDVWAGSGEALRTLGQVRGLEELTFTACDLRTPAFNEIGKLSSLRKLETVNCKFLPAQMAVVSNLTRLEYLDLMFTVFDESKEERIRLLGTLTADEARLREVLESSGEGEHIIEAALLTDRAAGALTNLTALKTLRLANTFVTPRSLPGIGGLEHLYAGIVGLTPENAGIWQRMPKLKSLGYFNVDDAQVVAIARLNNLESLNIWSGEVTDAGAEQLLKLQKLKQLEIRGNKMTDAGLLKLAGLPRLESLDIQYASRLTAEGVARFRAARPAIAIRSSELAATGAASRATQSAILPGEALKAAAGETSATPPVTPGVAVRGSEPDGWGEPVNGFAVRLRPEKRVVQGREVAEFQLDVRNQSGADVQLGRMFQGCFLEVDGQWFGASVDIDGDPFPPVFLKPGETHFALETLKLVAGTNLNTLGLLWHGSFPGREGKVPWPIPVAAQTNIQVLNLTSGNHIIRVAYNPTPDKTGYAHLAYSNPVELEVVAAEHSSAQVELGGKNQDHAEAWASETPPDLGLGGGVWNLPLSQFVPRPALKTITVVDFAFPDILTKVPWDDTTKDGREVVQAAGKGHLFVPEADVVVPVNGVQMAPVELEASAPASATGARLREAFGSQSLEQIVGRVKEWNARNRATSRFDLKAGALYVAAAPNGRIVALLAQGKPGEVWVQFIPIGSIKKTAASATLQDKPVAAIEKATPWGEAANGLQSRLLPAMQNAAPSTGGRGDTSVYVTYELRNVTNKPIRFLVQFTPLQEIAASSSVFSVLDTEGKRVRFMAAERSLVRPTTNHFVTVDPGQTISNRIAVPYDFTRPGSYRITSTQWHVGPNTLQAYYADNATKVAQNLDNVWTGKLESNEVQVDIVPANNAHSGGTNALTAPASQPKFAIYLVLGHTNAPFFRSTERGRIIFSDAGNGANRFDAMKPDDYPLEGLILAEKPLLTEADLLAYDRQRSLMRFKPGVMDRFPNPSVWGVPFAVVAEGKPLFIGAFWSGASSYSANMPVISEDRWRLGLPANDPDYLPPDAVRLENRQVVRAGALPRDPRQDERLYGALQEAGKLVDIRSVDEPWGEAVNGIAARLRTERLPQWSEDYATPWLLFDLKNDSKDLEVTLNVGGMPTELLIDGRLLYQNHERVAGQVPVCKPGQKAIGAVLILDKRWTAVNNDGRTTEFHLKPGKHKVQALVDALHAQPNSGPPIGVLSNPIEIEIVATNSAAVVESLVTRLSALAARYPELKGFPAYAAVRPDKLRIDYTQGQRQLGGKALAYDDKGLALSFQVSDDNLPSQPAASAMGSHLAALHLRVYADFTLSSSPSPGLDEALRSLLKEHMAMLEKLDEAAGNAAKPTPPR